MKVPRELHIGNTFTPELAKQPRPLLKTSQGLSRIKAASGIRPVAPQMAQTTYWEILQGGSDEDPHISDTILYLPNPPTY